MRHRDHLKALEDKRHQDDEDSARIEELLSRVNTDLLEQKEEQNKDFWSNDDD